MECFFRNTETELNARVGGARRGEEVTMLIARPTALAGIFDVLNEMPGAESLNRIPVRPDDIALSAEPAASTG